MGDDFDIEFQRITRTYEPGSVIRIANDIYYENPVLQYYNSLCSPDYNSLCSPETTEERSDAFQQFIKAEQKREEKEENYKQFKEFTRMLERTYYN